MAPGKYEIILGKRQKHIERIKRLKSKWKFTPGMWTKIGLKPVPEIFNLCLRVR